jgi:hypothetical protein
MLLVAGSYFDHGINGKHLHTALTNLKVDPHEVLVALKDYVDDTADKKG